MAPYISILILGTFIKEKLDCILTRKKKQVHISLDIELPSNNRLIRYAVKRVYSLQNKTFFLFPEKLLRKVLEH